MKVQADEIFGSVTATGLCNLPHSGTALAGLSGFAWHGVAAASALVSLLATGAKPPSSPGPPSIATAYVIGSLATLLLGAGQSCLAWSVGRVIAPCV